MANNIVSVIIPCYNGTRFLPETIESVLAQTYQHFEIIVVNDGSIDTTEEIAIRYPGVRYIRQENQGVAIARNTGLSESQGAYLVFLDQDDRLLPNALEVGVNCLKTHPECAFVYGRSTKIKADGSPLPGQPQQKTQIANYHAQLSGSSLVPPAAAIFRRTVLESIGGFDSSFVPADDYDLYLRISRAFQIYCHNHIIVEWRIHDNNQSLNSARTLEATLRVLDAQRDFIKGNTYYLKAYWIGRKRWQSTLGFYLPFEAIRQLKDGQLVEAERVMLFLLRHAPRGIITFPTILLSKLFQRYKFS